MGTSGVGHGGVGRDSEHGLDQSREVVGWSLLQPVRQGSEALHQRLGGAPLTSKLLDVVVGPVERKDLGLVVAIQERQIGLTPRPVGEVGRGRVRCPGQRPMQVLRRQAVVRQTQEQLAGDAQTFDSVEQRHAGAKSTLVGLGAQSPQQQRPRPLVQVVEVVVTPAESLEGNAREHVLHLIALVDGKEQPLDGSAERPHTFGFGVTAGPPGGQDGCCILWEQPPHELAECELHLGAHEETDDFGRRGWEPAQQAHDGPRRHELRHAHYRARRRPRLASARWVARA